MECTQSSIAEAAAPRKSRFPARDCLRKGCGGRFMPTSGSQRYCQDPDCLREVRRWHASRRQRVRRQRLEVRKADAVASRERRIRRSRIGQVASVSTASHPVRNRPGRVEPRAVKRRPKCLKLLKVPRSVARRLCPETG